MDEYFDKEAAESEKWIGRRGLVMSRTTSTIVFSPLFSDSSYLTVNLAHKLDEKKVRSLS